MLQPLSFQAVLYELQQTKVAEMELFYFKYNLSRDTGKLSVQGVQKCKAFLSTQLGRHGNRVGFQYLTKSGKWSNAKPQETMKQNAYYYTSYEAAEADLKAFLNCDVKRAEQMSKAYLKAKADAEELLKQF